MPSCEPGARGLAVNPTESGAAITRAPCHLEVVQLALNKSVSLITTEALNIGVGGLLKNVLLVCRLQEEVTRQSVLRKE